MEEWNSQANTLYKLMILYMLQKVEYTLSFTRLSDFVLGRGYTSWFTLHASAAELQEAGLVHADTVRNMTYYAITPEGEKTLGYFLSRIPLPIREDMDQYLEANHLSIVNDSAVLSDYRRTSSGEYIAHCVIREKFGVVMELSLTVPGEKQAAAICRNWSEKSQQIYEELLGTLMTDVPS